MLCNSEQNVSVLISLRWLGLETKTNLQELRLKNKEKTKRIQGTEDAKGEIRKEVKPYMRHT